MPALLRARAASESDEEQVIVRLAGARKAPADLVLRARIIAFSWGGRRVATIAAEVGCHAKTVRWWLHRFNTLGAEGLQDRRVSGCPRRITEAERSRIVLHDHEMSLLRSSGSSVSCVQDQGARPDGDMPASWIPRSVLPELPEA
ncbi:transposase [Streptomyces sp. NPDC058664]|uniref:helix-turn-helix domain-containing protein n=1 Tax=unclassified Streptomyces TaxID=2593676 RepID=UPI003660EE35